MEQATCNRNNNYLQHSRTEDVSNANAVFKISAESAAYLHDDDGNTDNGKSKKETASLSRIYCY